MSKIIQTSLLEKHGMGRIHPSNVFFVDTLKAKCLYFKIKATKFLLTF